LNCRVQGILIVETKLSDVVAGNSRAGAVFTGKNVIESERPVGRAGWNDWNKSHKLGDTLQDRP